MASPQPRTRKWEGRVLLVTGNYKIVLIKISQQKIVNCAPETVGEENHLQNTHCSHNIII